MNQYVKAISSVLSVLLVSFPMAVQAVTYAYIPNRGDNTVTRVATQDETFDIVELSGGPYGAAVMPDGSAVLVTLTDNDTVARITNANFSGSGTPQILDVGDEPRGVAIEPGGLYAYVANYSANTVTKIDVGTFTVEGAPIDVGVGPWGVAAHYDEDETITRVYVSNYVDNSITVISDDNLDTTIKTIENVCTDPVGLALTPDGGFLYVACFNNGDTGKVAIVQTSDNTVVKTLSINREEGSWGVAVGSDGAYVYVSNSESDSLTVIRTSDQAVDRTYPTGTVGEIDQPMGVAAPKYGDFAYVVNHLSDSINRIDHSDSSSTLIGEDQIHGAFALGAFIGGVPPAAPSDLEATAHSYSRIDLTWTSTVAESDMLGFKIERRTEGDTEFSQIAKVEAGQTSYEDGGLDDNTTYEYRVRAYNETADSDYSDSAEATTEEGSFSLCFVGTLMLP